MVWFLLISLWILFLVCIQLLCCIFVCLLFFFFFRQMTAYELRISDWSSDVCSSDLPATNFYLARHVGDVFYGNVGAVDRLDFTVIGPAVNEASRISGMCRSLDQQVVLSSAFAAEAKASRDRQTGRASWRERVCQSV